MISVANPGTHLKQIAIIIAVACSVFAGCKSESVTVPDTPAPALSTFHDAEIAGRCSNGHSVLSKTPLKVSETGFWCWAASGQMAMNALETGHDHPQCLQAGILAQPTRCCKNSKPVGCLIAGVPPLSAFSFASLTSTVALTEDKIVDELCVGKRPFLAVWPIGGGGSHMTVVVDYDYGKTGDAIVINDPWTEGHADRYVTPYSEYHNEHGTKNNDIYSIKKMTP